MEMTLVKCPFCGRNIPYTLIARQLIKKKHDKALILKIVSELGEAISGDILKQYNILHNPITSRHLKNLLNELENEGKIRQRVEHRGRYGMTTIITTKGN